MQLFLDSADPAEIRQAVAWGVIDGVTTNPSLIAHQAAPMRQVLAEICAAVEGPVSAECVAETAEGMAREGRALAALHPNVVVKLPLTIAGLQAVRTLHAEGIRTNVTLCFSVTQGLLAAKVGATYLSPFVGRLDDIGQPGLDLVRDLVALMRQHGFATRVLAASMRTPPHLAAAALAGAHAATLSLKLLRQLYAHPLTTSGNQQFLADWAKSGQAALA